MSRRPIFWSATTKSGSPEVKYLDLPPIWLVGALCLVWLSPWPLIGAAGFWPGIGLLAIAAVLTAGALLEFGRAKTTVIPHQNPSALISGGIFRFTRNPIYLADVLILLGFSLIWSKLLGLILVLPFVLLLQRRFILPEEARLKEAFGSEFEQYTTRTRRWL